MPRMLFGLLPVVAVSIFTLLIPGKVVAELPNEGSGEMVVDQVCEGLRQYRKEEDDDKRFELLMRLAKTRDPRVAVLLGEILTASVRVEWGIVSCLLLGEYYLPHWFDRTGAEVKEWWEKNETDLRRRAKQLPK